MVSDGHVTLYELMFDHLLFTPFVVTVGCVKYEEPVIPCILDDVVMYVVVKGDVFEVIGYGRTKNWIMLCKSRQ